MEVNFLSLYLPKIEDENNPLQNLCRKINKGIIQSKLSSMANVSASKELDFLSIMSVFSGYEFALKTFKSLTQLFLTKAEIFFDDCNEVSSFIIQDIFLGAVLNIQAQSETKNILSQEEFTKVTNDVRNRMLTKHSFNMARSMEKVGHCQENGHPTAIKIKEFMAVHTNFNEEVYTNLCNSIAKCSEIMGEGEAFAHYVYLKNSPTEKFYVILQQKELGQITYKKFTAVNTFISLDKDQMYHLTQEIHHHSCLNQNQQSNYSSLLQFRNNVLSGVDLRFVSVKVNPDQFYQNYLNIPA